MLSWTVSAELRVAAVPIRAGIAEWHPGEVLGLLHVIGARVGVAGARSELDGDLQCVTGPFAGDAEGLTDFFDRQHVAEQRGYVDRGIGD